MALKNWSASRRLLLCVFFVVIGLALQICHTAAQADDATTNNAAKPSSGDDEMINDDATVDEEKAGSTATKAPSPADEAESKKGSDGATSTPSSTDVSGGDASNAEDEAKRTGMLDGFTAPSEHAQTVMAFESPSIGVPPNPASQAARQQPISAVEIPANRPVTVLIGFTNRDARKPDDNEVAENQPRRFTLDYVAGAFRYPQDYSYYVQNFSAAALPPEQTVDPFVEKTVSYTFVPALNLANRPFGLAIRVGYHDQDNKQYTHHVFNQTISIIEVDEGFDTESFFLYIMIVAALVLAAFGLYHVFLQYGSRKLKKVIRGGGGSAAHGGGSHASGGSGDGVYGGGTSDANNEMGTSGAGIPGISKDVNLEWVPSSHIKLLKPSSSSVHNNSHDMSPRKRKNLGASAKTQKGLE